MKTLPEKIREARNALGLSQTELGALVGVSLRSIVAYEKGEKYPREKTMFQLAKALRVSIKYLKEDECENPTEDIDKDPFIVDASEKFGMSGSKDMERMLAENTALFAGGELSQEEKDIYFNALYKAYTACREQAKEKFGKKKIK